MHIRTKRLQWALVVLIAYVFVGCGGDRYDKYAANPPANNSDAASNSATTSAKVSGSVIAPEPAATALGEAAKPPAAAQPTVPAVEAPPERVVPETTPETTPEVGLPDSPSLPLTESAVEPQPSTQNYADSKKSRFEPTFGGESELVQTGRNMIVSDQMLPVDVAATYKMSVTLFATGPKATVSTNYVGFICCDKDEQWITTYHVAKFPGARDTTLAADLEPGDRQLVLQNAAGWNNGGVEAQRSLAWYPGTDELHAANVYTYTRHIAKGLWGQGAIANNTIQLRKPWAGPQLFMGTPVRNTTSGGTYNYALLAGEAVPNVPTTYTATIKGVWKDGTYSDTRFRPGTAFIQPLILSDWRRDSRETGTTLTVRNFLCERIAE